MTGTGAEEVFELAREFGKVPTRVAFGLYDAYSAAGEEFRDEWRDNARVSAGAHGKHYPDAVTSEARRRGLSVIEVDVGPESSKKQGGMGPGFEFGSVNQPPHLDGLRALPAAERRVERLMDETIEEALP